MQQIRVFLVGGAMLAAGLVWLLSGCGPKTVVVEKEYMVICGNEAEIVLNPQVGYHSTGLEFTTQQGIVVDTTLDKCTLLTREKAVE